MTSRNGRSGMGPKMMKLMLLLVSLAPWLAAQDDVVMKAMRDEMARSKAELRLPDMDKPYYIEYRVDDATTTTIGATLGVLTNKNFDRDRTFTLQVRVGDYAFDNTNFLSVQSFGGRMGNMFQRRSLPLDDDYDQIRRDIWLATDYTYKQAASGLAAKKSVLQTRKYSTNLPDFTAQKPVTLNEARTELQFDQAAAEKLARELSAVFRNNPDIIASEAQVIVRSLYARYLNSEGTTFTRSEPYVRVSVEANSRAVDGMPIESSFSVYGRAADLLHSPELMERTKAIADKIVKLRNADSIERYNGPVLFEGEAAPGVLSEVFAPAVAAARFPLTDQPQFEAAMQQMMGQMGGVTLVEKLGAKVMPEFLDVSDKPLLSSIEGKTLLGTRKIDDEGVPAQDVTIVENGILKNLIATRTPTAEAKASTGSKGMFGAVPSNLFLTAKKSESNEELRQHLLKLAKARGYDYGLVVKHAGEGGLSWLVKFAGAMGAPNESINTSVDIYKVFADGHEEIVREVEVSSLTPNSFKEIVAVGDKPVIYNGSHIPTMNAIMSGAGAGNMTGDIFAIGSFIAPAILFEEISLKRANKPAPNPPVVPSPLPAFTQK